MNNKTRFLLFCIMLLIFIICIFLSSSLMLYLLYVHRDEPIPERDVCTSHEFRVAETVLLHHMDKSAEPCTNWYEYACGGYQNKARSSWDVLRRYGKRRYTDWLLIVEKNIFDYLNDTNNQFHNYTSPWMDQARKFYHSCLLISNWSEFQKISLSIRFVLDRIRSKAFNDPISNLNSLLKYYFDSGIPMLFNIQAVNSYDNKCPIFGSNSQHVCLYLVEPILHQEIDIKDIAKTKSFWKIRFNGFLKALSRYRTDSVLALRLGLSDYLDLHFNMTKIRQLYLRQPHGHHMLNRTKYQTKFKWNCVNLNKNLLNVVNDITDDMQSTLVFVEGQELICRIYDYLSGLPSDLVANYFLWEVFLQLHLMHPNNIHQLKAIKDLMSSSSKALLHDGYDFDEDYRRCVHVTYSLFRQQFRSLFDTNRDTSSYKAFNNFMLHEIKTSFQRNFRKSNWRSAHTKTSFDLILDFTAKHFENSFAGRISTAWFPNFENYSDSNYLEMLLDYNKQKSYHSKTFQSLHHSLICATDYTISRNFFLDGLFFNFLADPLYPMYWNFGGLGYWMAYEFGHQLETNRASILLDIQTSFTDSNYETVYLIRRECFLNLYSGLKNSSRNSEKSFLARNLADFLGISISLDALNNYYQVNATRKLNELRCGSNEYHYDRHFFLRVTQNFCEEISASQYAVFYNNSSELSGFSSAGKYRAKYAFHSIDAIKESFHCSLDSSFDLRERCSYW